VGEPSDGPGDLMRRQEAERGGWPFLEYRDADGAQRILRLGDTMDRLVMGRRATCDVPLDWDARVSRVHAKLERVAGEWTLVDDGLSRNGTFVNGQRVTAQHRLEDRDVIRLGHTYVQFRAPGRAEQATAPGSRPAMADDITEAKRRVLVALCRPVLAAHGQMTLTATNEQISGELHLSVEAVKAHLRELYRRFEIGDLPQNEKRMRLAHIAIQNGLVRPSDAS